MIGVTHSKERMRPPTEGRARIMSAVRGRGNKSTEIALTRAFRRERITGWRRHQPLLGCPDFTFRRQRVVIFTDGCFWHGCPRCYLPPSRNKFFWRDKVENNKRRDRRVTLELRKAGWRVVRIWEHDLHPNVRSRVIRRILKLLS